MSRESRKPFIEESLELDVPADVAYGESRELEHFPLFLPEVMRVERLEDQRFRWVADYAGTSVVREVEIEGIVPGRQISWRAHGVPEYFGTLSVEQLGTERSRVRIQVYREGMAPLPERAAELQAWIERLGTSMRRFKEFVEARRVTHERVFASTQPPRPGRFPGDVGLGAHLEEAGAPPEEEIGLPREEETPSTPPGPEEF